jgi:hypothetical protein
MEDSAEMHTPLRFIQSPIRKRIRLRVQFSRYQPELHIDPPIIPKLHLLQHFMQLFQLLKMGHLLATCTSPILYNSPADVFCHGFNERTRIGCDLDML